MGTKEDNDEELIFMSGSKALLYFRPKSLSPENTERTIKNEQDAITKTKDAIKLIKFTILNLLLEKKYFFETKKLIPILYFFSFRQKRTVFDRVFCCF